MVRASYLLLTAAVAGASCNAKPAGPRATPADDAGGSTAFRASPLPDCDLEACAERCAACQEACSAAGAAACHRLAELLVTTPEQPLDLPRTADAYRRACAGGDGEACAALAIHYIDGRGVARDATRARELSERACSAGVGVACFNLGMWHDSGLLPIEEAAARGYFRSAEKHYRRDCDSGQLVWCMNLGVLYEEGFLGARAPERAEPLYQRACTEGWADACSNLALLWLDGGDVARVDQSVTLLDQQCRAGNPLNCAVLGQLYLTGRHGIARQPGRAVGLLGSSCDRGVRQACAVLAATYGLGDDIERDLTRALDLERRACDLGDSTACFLVASTARAAGATGVGVVADYLERACNIGHGEACALLAGLYRGVEGVDADPARADGFGLRGCQLGDPGACADLVERGQPLPLPPSRAQRMQEGLCRGGVTRACR